MAVWSLASIGAPSLRSIDKCNFYRAAANLFFDPTRLKVTVDLASAPVGHTTLRISEQKILHWQNLTLQQVNPESLRISVAKSPPKERDIG